MLYRDRKKNDMNEGKWLGIGGKIEPGESQDECNAREVLEETGLIVRSAVFHGIIRFRSDEYPAEDMYLYSTDDFIPADKESAEIFLEEGRYEPPECSEGRLEWICKDRILDLPLWDGDRYFLEQLVSGKEKISMTLKYTGDICTVTDMED